ncbi:MAG: hypothetical protein ACYC9O_11415 [Candidatus Latescibacterota bacterium]
MHQLREYKRRAKRKLLSNIRMTAFQKNEKNVKKTGKNTLKTQKKCDITHGIRFASHPRFGYFCPRQILLREK